MLKGLAAFRGRTRHEQNMQFYIFLNAYAGKMSDLLLSRQVSNATEVAGRSATDVCLNVCTRSSAASKLSRVVTRLHSPTWSHAVGRCRLQTLKSGAGPFLCCWGSLPSRWDHRSLTLQLRSWLCPLVLENKTMKANIWWKSGLFLRNFPLNCREMTWRRPLQTKYEETNFDFL